jgi:hypothetical protein
MRRGGRGLLAYSVERMAIALAHTGPQVRLSLGYDAWGQRLGVSDGDAADIAAYLYTLE